MKRLLSFLALLSCFAFTGNAQESVPQTYVTQGNVQQNKSIYENEMQRAALEARRLKELKAAMASSGANPAPVYTTAEEFLAANRPPMPAPSEPRPAPVRRDAYVPDFDVSESNPDGGSSVEMPEKERSFFKWLKGKKKKEPEVSFEPVGASEYSNVYEEPVSEEAAPGVPMAPEFADPPAASSAVSRSDSEEERSSIFVSREQGFAPGSQLATVKKETEILADDVRVRVFPGTSVAVLGEDKGDVAIQLSDGRIGLIKEKYLDR
ncbi:MAG: hypothetical protein P1U68_06795 [Verrucomicrobiales bacterium]|nr:hypothetical protein [Verrucomicrobiales bacterium]